MSLWHGLEEYEDTCYSTVQEPLQGPEIDSHPEAGQILLVFSLSHPEMLSTILWLTELSTNFLPDLFRTYHHCFL